MLAFPLRELTCLAVKISELKLNVHRTCRRCFFSNGCYRRGRGCRFV